VPSLRNLEFVHDDAWNLQLYAPFDAAFCCGLLYHLDRPAEYLRLLGRAVRRVLVVNTHFAPAGTPDPRFPLSGPAENEGLPGRWFFEHDSDDPAEREPYRWAAWANHRSFWLTREALAHAIRAAGFDLVYEQFDCHVTEGETDLLQTLREGYPTTQHRAVFVGVRMT